jgi:hypothetical protein
MCIVVDPPLFVPMFKASDPEHAMYQPVRDWVENGLGKFVTGGATYKKELSRVSSILRILGELEKKGKLVKANDNKVDAEEVAVKKIFPLKDFDDPHLVAIVRTTLCKVICIRDPRAHKYLRHAKLYESTKHRPSLYTRPKNRALLCDKHICGCCK